MVRCYVNWNYFVSQTRRRHQPRLTLLTLLTALGAVAVVPWNPKRQRNRSCLPPTWTTEELGKRTSIERFFGRVFSLFSCFRLQRPPLCGWSAVARRVALTYAATIIVALAAHQAGRPDLIRSPTRVLAHLWEVGDALSSRIS